MEGEGRNDKQRGSSDITYSALGYVALRIERGGEEERRRDGGKAFGEEDKEEEEGEEEVVLEPS